MVDSARILPKLRLVLRMFIFMERYIDGKPKTVFIRRRSRTTIFTLSGFVEAALAVLIVHVFSTARHETNKNRKSKAIDLQAINDQQEARRRRRYSRSLIRPSNPSTATNSLIPASRLYQLCSKHQYLSHSTLVKRIVGK